MPFLQAAGRRLEYQWRGPDPEAAPTLVFLHGGLGCAAMWRGFPALLAHATGCGALVYSRAGYGRSEPVTLPRSLRFMHEEGLTVLPEVLEVARVREAILFGHSDGGSIALIFAGSGAASRLRALVLEAPHVFCEDLTTRSIASAARAYRDGDLRSRLERYHGPNVDGAFWGWNQAWLDPDFSTWSIAEYLPRVRVPTLAIQGEADEYGTLQQIDALEAGCAGPVRRLVLPDCGHAPHRDQPDRVLAVASAFLLDALRQA